MKYTAEEVCPSIYATLGTDEAGAEVMANPTSPTYSFPHAATIARFLFLKKTIERFPLICFPPRYHHNK